MKKIIAILLLTGLLTLAGCQSTNNDVELVSAPTESAVSNAASDIGQNSQAVLEITKNPDGTFSMTNGDIVGPLYKKYYYDILSRSHFIFSTKDNNTTCTSVVYGEYFKLDTENSQGEISNYILLYNKSGTFWMDKDKKTVSELKNHDVSSIRNSLSDQIFTNLKYLKTYEQEFDGVKYTVEEHKYTDADGHILFFFKDNTLKRIQDDNNSMDILEISSDVTMDMLNIPDGYKETPIENVTSQNSQTSSAVVPTE